MKLVLCITVWLLNHGSLLRLIDWDSYPSPLASSQAAYVCDVWLIQVQRIIFSFIFHLKMFYRPEELQLSKKAKIREKSEKGNAMFGIFFPILWPFRLILWPVEGLPTFRLCSLSFSLPNQWFNCGSKIFSELTDKATKTRPRRMLV